MIELWLKPKLVVVEINLKKIKNFAQEWQDVRNFGNLHVKRSQTYKDPSLHFITKYKIFCVFCSILCATINNVINLFFFFGNGNVVGINKIKKRKKMELKKKNYNKITIIKT